jgi:C4-dicarboxylate transporter DctM subunit
MEALVLFGVALVLALLNIPIAVALGGAAIVTIWVFGLAPLDAVPSLAYSSIAKFTILAVPYFIIAGYLLERSGIAERLIALADQLVGGLKGGLAYVTIVVSVFFAGISGSGTADTAALGAILLPAMRKAGYRKEFSAALIACGGSIGIIIPPSITFVLYGSITGASIGKLFVAGIIPGILIASALAVPSYFAARHIILPAGQQRSAANAARAARSAAWGLAAPVIILGGIYSGIFTPTEAAGVVVVYALAVGIFVYRALPLHGLGRLFADGALITSMALVIVVGASLFAWVITRLGLSSELASAVTGLSSEPLVIVLLLVVILLIAGMFLDALSITFVFIPIFLPLLRTADIDLTWFGVLFTVCMAIGQVSPPIGVNLFISTGLAEARFAGVVVAVLPMIAAELIVLILLIVAPDLSLWLPRALGMP